MQLAENLEGWVLNEPDVMEVTGRLDGHTAPNLEEDALLCVQSGARRLLLDCAELSYISGAGLRTILTLAHAMQETQGRFAVCDLQPQVRGMFEACGYDSIISIYDTRNEAIAAFAG